jgi:hypothetical protein
VHFLYLDESGKSGPQDFQQPWYVLGGLIVQDSRWHAMEADLNSRIDALVPPPRPETWELHMAHIFHGKSHFKRMPYDTRYGLVDAAFDVLHEHQATLILVGIEKRAYSEGRWSDPVESVAYRFMIERFNNYLRRQEDHLGAVVFDEQKEQEGATRRAHSRYRRQGTGWQTIDNILETPFFTPSHWSRMLQLVDVATYWAAKYLAGGDDRYWPQIEELLDCWPDYRGKGLKTFPS